MSQQVWATINPDATSGTMLAALLTDFKDALMTGMAGTSRPSQLQAGGMWIDTTLQNAPNYQWIYKVWTGTVDIEVFRINVNSNYGGSLTSESLFEVQQISADTVGAIQQLIKNRIADNGQVLSGDTVGEIRFVGRTVTGTDPTVAYIKWTATDDQEVGAFGGTLSFFSTPDASSVITEHMRFIEGQVETLVPLQLKAFSRVSQNIATASAIVQLSGANSVVEFTGSTPTDVQGINSGHASREITLHNRSSAAVNLKHANGSAAAADRFDLPGNLDYTIEPDNTITVYYSAAQSLWKLKSSARIGATKTSEIIPRTQDWVCPTNVTSINLTSYTRKQRTTESGWMDQYGNLFASGENQNTDGVLGVGDVTNRSSHVLVSGGLKFSRLSRRIVGATGTSGYNTFGMLEDGSAYGWGNNAHGQIGCGDVTRRSAPTAVLGGFKYRKMYHGCTAVVGMTSDGLLYTWGRCPYGGLGIGATGARSSPVAVLGGIRFSDVAWVNPVETSTADGSVSAVGISLDGVLYAWGKNDRGQLGVGDLTNRSSPVAVVGMSGKRFIQVGGISHEDSNVATFYALTDAGELYAWGYNGRGRVGDGTRTDRSSPVLITGGAAGYTEFWPVPFFGIMARGTDGQYWGWGAGNGVPWGGGLTFGRTTSDSVSSPVVVLSGFNFDQIVVGWNNAFGLSGDKYYAWGNNPNDSNGTGGLFTSPTLLAGSARIADVQPRQSGFGTFNYGFGVTGEMYAWGYNFYGGLGVGDTTDRSSPSLVTAAFGGNGTWETQTATLSVTPGNTYRIRMGNGICSFGNTPIGIDIQRVTIDYTKRGNA